MDMRFAVMIDSGHDESSVMDFVLAGLQGSVKDGGYIKYGANVISLDKNPLYEDEEAVPEEDAWMHFRYELHVFPVAEVRVEGQLALAGKIMEIIRCADGKAELIAEFAR